MHAGLWIDHRKAVIVVISDEGEATKEVTAQVEKHVRFSGGTASGESHRSQKGTGEDTRERRFGGQLDRYYDEVITHLRDAKAILIFGPGEAKGELKARLERDGLGASVVAVETVDKMTDRQIAAKVRERFPR
ncbi:MAG: hypothetical protein ACM3PF_05540 [Bacteroidota bacterium]